MKTRCLRTFGLCAMSLVFAFSYLITDFVVVDPVAKLETPVLANVVAQTLPGTIRGAENPELIPDDRAYEMVLLVASASENDSDADKARAAAVVGNILGDAVAEARVLAAAANRYRAAYDEYVVQGAFASSEALFEQGRAELITGTVRELDSRLSPIAQARLRVYVENEKRNMILYELPDMQASKRPLWDRLLLAETAHAQMNPSGTAYTNRSADANRFYATGVVDARSSCGCHRSSVTVKIRFPSGRNASNSSGLGGELKQTTASLSLSPSDLTNGDIKIESVYYSFCPLAGYEFIKRTGVQWVPLRNIHAYYRYIGNDVYRRCNPRGSICDNVAELNFTNRPGFVLMRAWEFDFAAIHACVAQLDKVVDKCYSPDPRP